MMKSFSLVVGFALLARVSDAISWPLILDADSTNGNVWTEMQYTIQVPPGPPSDVDTGPWFFWCGLQPNGGGVVQPVLTWGETVSPYVNPNPSFSTIWAMTLWDVPVDGFNNDVSDISDGIWVDQNAQVLSAVSYANGQWTQESQVLSGAAEGLTTSSTVTASQYFNTDSAGDSNANFFLCESELDGSQTSQWDFPVYITDIYIHAETSDGVEALCGAAVSFSDGNGYADISGFEMVDDQTCYFASVTLTPPS